MAPLIQSLVRACLAASHQGEYITPLQEHMQEGDPMASQEAQERAKGTVLLFYDNLFPKGLTPGKQH